MSKLILKVDNREGKLKPLFDEQKELQVVYETLEYGDFQLIHEGETVPLFIFERKTLDDLLASIKDGRYKNQKARLLQTFQPSQLYYIIEGKCSYHPSTKATDKILQSAIINTQLRDKISCFITQNLQDTFHLICGIFTRVKDDQDKYINVQATTQEQTVVMTKNASEPSKVFQAMLCQIPGISDKSASVVVEKWQQFKHMYDELIVLSHEERNSILDNLKHPSTNRRLGKRTVEGILKYMF